MDLLGYALWFLLIWWIASPRSFAKWAADVAHHYSIEKTRLERDEAP